MIKKKKEIATTRGIDQTSTDFSGFLFATRFFFFSVSPLSILSDVSLSTIVPHRLPSSVLRSHSTLCTSFFFSK